MVRLFVLLLFSLPSFSFAINYMEPEQSLIDIVDVPFPPRISISPDFRWCLLRTPQKNNTIAQMAQPELKLAGMRFRPATLAPTRQRVYTSIALMDMSTQEIHPIKGLPDNLAILSTAWSPDGSMVIFTNETPEGIELWLIRAEEKNATRLTDASLNLTARAFPVWLSSGDGVITTMRVQNQGNPPRENPIPSGPIVQETTGEAAPVRTMQDLLQSPYDEELFRYYLTSQLSLVSLDGSVTPIGSPGIVWDFDTAPGEDLILLHTILEPFSYSVTASRFPMRICVVDLDGNSVFQVANLPLRNNIPLAIGSVHTGPRSVQWRTDTPATLCWVEALDGGDAEKPAELRDRVYTLKAPFDLPATTLADLHNRFGGVYWGTDSLALLAEWWWPDRNEKIWRIAPACPSRQPELLFDFSMEDPYSDPGTPVTTTGRLGRKVLFSPDGNFVFMKGDGASPEGNIPFLKKLDLNTLTQETVFLSEAPYYERPVTFLDSTGTALLFLRESPHDYPDFFVRDLETGIDTRITDSPYPTPQLLGMSKQLITYQRSDGLQLSATLYTPPGYSVEDGTLPVVVWAYPQDFVSSNAASRITSSPYEFDYIGWWSPLVWLTKGYAVLDYPSMPVVAEEGSRPNDTFVEQLVMDAEAAVDAVVEMGIGDRNKFVIGGHSYGAFMTVNLLAHSDLFAAGVASTGAYNRTLTPFGFQSEDRSLWDAPDVYWNMSPFMFADSINEPLLIFHGSADDNPGTFPIQSERLFAAVKGLGGTARLVMLPLEGHVYYARESVLHYLWEISNWLDLYVGE